MLQNVFVSKYDVQNIDNLTILTCFEAHKSRIDGELIALFCRNVSRIKGISARPEDIRTTFEATDSI